MFLQHTQEKQKEKYCNFPNNVNFAIFSWFPVLILLHLYEY